VHAFKADEGDWRRLGILAEQRLDLRAHDAEVVGVGR
jgi:hypothetical protein